LQSRFNDPNYTPAELINLIASADAIFNLTACFARSGVASMKIIAHEHGSTAITHQRLVPANQQVQIVTVPHSSTGADFDVIMLAPDGSEVARTNEFAPAELGQDTFITPACNTQVSVSPSNGPNVPTSGTQQFTAAVTGNGNTAVTWTATGGSINSSGLYTAGGAPGIYSVTATSVADPTQKATVTVNVTSTVAPPPARITFQAISPEAATVKFRARLVSFPFHTVQFTVDARSDGSGFLYPRGPLPPGVITSNVLPPSNLDPFTEDWIVEVTVPTRFLQPAVEGVTLEVKACYFKPDGGPMLGADRLPLCSILQLFY
jgi:hypothetical protein